MRSARVETDEAGPAQTDTTGAARNSRALTCLLGAATLAVVPIATTALAPAGNGNGAHSSPVYLLAQLAHDIGHNDWAFQGGVAGRVSWAVAYLALGVFWLAVALWMRWHGRSPGAGVSTPWLRVLCAAWGALLLAALLTTGAAVYADWTSTAAGPLLLRAADAFSPWWSGVAALAVVANAERDETGIRVAAGYGALLAMILLVPLPGPNSVKTLILASAAALPAVFAPREQTDSRPQRGSGAAVTLGATAQINSDAAAAG
jgi:hypothetical protein